MSRCPHEKTRRVPAARQPCGDGARVLVPFRCPLSSNPALFPPCPLPTAGPSPSRTQNREPRPLGPGSGPPDPRPRTPVPGRPLPTPGPEPPARDRRGPCTSLRVATRVVERGSGPWESSLLAERLWGYFPLFATRAGGRLREEGLVFPGFD